MSKVVRWSKKDRNIRHFQKRIGGVTYAIEVDAPNKRRAVKEAEKIRGKGGRARVLPDGSRSNPAGWLVYTPVKKSKRTRRQVSKTTRKKSSKRKKDPFSDLFRC